MIQHGGRSKAGDSVAEHHEVGLEAAAFAASMMYACRRPAGVLLVLALGWGVLSCNQQTLRVVVPCLLCLLALIPVGAYVLANRRSRQRAHVLELAAQRKRAQVEDEKIIARAADVEEQTRRLELSVATEKRLMDDIEYIIDQYIDRLVFKRRTLVVEDDYGDEDISLWQAELQSFYRRKILPQISAHAEDETLEAHVFYLIDTAIDRCESQVKTTQSRDSHCTKLTTSVQRRDALPETSAYDNLTFALEVLELLANEHCSIDWPSPSPSDTELLIEMHSRTAVLRFIRDGTTVSEEDVDNLVIASNVEKTTGSFLITENALGEQTLAYAMANGVKAICTSEILRISIELSVSKNSGLSSLKFGTKLNCALLHHIALFVSWFEHLQMMGWSYKVVDMTDNGLTAVFDNGDDQYTTMFKGGKSHLTRVDIEDVCADAGLYETTASYIVTGFEIDQNLAWFARARGVQVISPGQTLNELT